MGKTCADEGSLFPERQHGVRVVLTGQAGIDKKPFAEEFAGIANLAERGMSASGLVRLSPRTVGRGPCPRIGEGCRAGAFVRRRYGQSPELRADRVAKVLPPVRYD